MALQLDRIRERLDLYEKLMRLEVIARFGSEVAAQQAHTVATAKVD